MPLFTVKPRPCKGCKQLTITEPGNVEYCVVNGCREKRRLPGEAPGKCEIRGAKEAGANGLILLGRGQRTDPPAFQDWSAKYDERNSLDVTL